MLRYRFWKVPYRTTRISTVAKWDYGSRENQYRATRFSTIAISEKYGSGRTMETSQVIVVVILRSDLKNNSAFFKYVMNSSAEM